MVFHFVQVMRMINSVLIADVHIICHEIGTDFNS